MDNLLASIQPILLDYPLAAPIVFIGVHTLMAVFFLPCSPMTLIAGGLWGGAYGLIISMVATIVSSATTFLFSRSFLRGRIEIFLMQRYPKIIIMLNVVRVNDLKLIALSQLNPLMPSSAMGYFFGLTRVSYLRYLLFSGLFMLPLQTMFVMTGHSVRSMLTFDGHWKVALTLIVLLVIFNIMSKHIYRKLCQLFGVKNGA
jgi:uncharacterized membrane protein YdjX (TVP38/TMEM64 family)